MEPTTATDPTKDIPAEVLALISAGNAKRFRVIPLNLQGNVLTVAIANPKQSLEALDTIRFISNRDVKAVACSPEAISAALEKHYGRGNVTPALTGQGELVSPSIDGSIDLKGETF